MKTITPAKPASKAIRSTNAGHTVCGEARRNEQRALKAPADRQVAEFEQTFSVRWEW
jgi:hypothetical protein